MLSLQALDSTQTQGKMKLFLSLIFLIFLCKTSFSQEVEMITDWEIAKEKAIHENKLILIILTGSEWCAPCKKMDKNLINNLEFQEYANQKLVVFLIDLPKTLVIDSELYQNYLKFKNRYKSDALPSLIHTKSDGTKINTLKGKLFKLKNMIQQLKV